jgi:CHAT domain-containing protein
VERLGDRHLTEWEFDALATYQNFPGGALDLGSELDGLARHVSDCRDCRKRLDERLVEHGRLNRIGLGSKAERRPSCPEIEELMNLAAGLAEPDTARKLLEHSSACDHCGPVLKTALEDFTGASSSDEERLLASLASSSPGGQSQLAERLSTSVTGGQSIEGRTTGRKFWTWRWGFASAGVAGLVAAILLLAFFRRELPIDRLLGDAYAESANLEIQIPGARRHVAGARSGGGKSLVERPALATAISEITKELVRHPDNPKWLEAKGRAQLLAGDPDGAIESFTRVQEITPDFPFLLTDFGAAYYERGKNGTNADAAKSIHYFTLAREKDRNDHVALFNRALAFEKAQMFGDARQDWEEYLKSFPKSEWASEVRDKLRKLPRSGGASPESHILDPKELGRLESSKLEALVSAHLEDYLDAASEDWLVRAAGPESDQAAATAVRLVARIAAEKAGDLWLTNLLEESSHPEVFRGAQSLLNSVRSNRRGDFAQGFQEARQASVLFHREHSEAGELRARLEEAYSLKLSDQGRACITSLHGAEKLAGFRRYKWVAIRLGIEKGDCLSITGDFGGGLAALRDARRDAEAGKFPSSYLRATAFIADVQIEIGDVPAGWKTIMEGLTFYHQGAYSPMRAYNLYAALDELADASHLWNFQSLVWREAIRTIADEENPLLKAMAYSRLGSATLMAGHPQESAIAFEEAKKFLAASPRSDATRNREIDAEVWLARAEARVVDADGAFDRLHAMEETVQRISSEYVVLDYYGALGEISWRLHRLPEAREAVNKCVAASEKSLYSLKSEEDRIRWSRASSDCYRLAVELDLRAGETTRALETWEWFRAAPLRTKQGISSLPVRLRISAEQASPGTGPRGEISRRIGALKEQTRIAYAVFQDGLGIWVYDDRGIHGKWVSIDPEDLAHQVDAFTQLCANPRTDVSALQRKGSALYAVLFGSIAEWLPSGGRVVVIEPDEALSGAPLEALTDPRGRYLAETRVLAWSPGAYYSAFSESAPRTVTTAPVLIVAAPAVSHFDNGPLDPIPEAFVEGQSVARRFQNSKLVVGDEATVTSVRDNLRGATLFHFAGHAVARNRQPGLLLVADEPGRNNGSLLTADMVKRLPLMHLQLAVLAACSTQNGSEGSAFDPDSLARAFLRAGAKRVVSSRWNVDSASTSTLLERFYSEWAAGRSVSESLRRAEEAVRMETKTSHPFFWASFAVIGE